VTIVKLISMHVKQTRVLLAAIVQIPLQKTKKQTPRYPRIIVLHAQRGIMIMAPNARVRMWCQTEQLVIDRIEVFKRNMTVGIRK